MSEYDSSFREFGWDDEIQNDSTPFEVLPEGDYRFRVEKFERGRHSGSEKIPPCNKAILTLSVNDGAHSGTVQTNLFLFSRFEWKLCQFFTAIGQRRHGEAIRMNWSLVPGAIGTCHVGTRKWMGNDGKEHEGNEITEFYDPEEAPDISEKQVDSQPAPGQGAGRPPPGMPVGSDGTPAIPTGGQGGSRAGLVGWLS